MCVLTESRAPRRESRRRKESIRGVLESNIHYGNKILLFLYWGSLLFVLILAIIYFVCIRKRGKRESSVLVTKIKKKKIFLS